MHNKSKEKVKNSLEYILILALYYVTGGAFSYNYYSVQITLFLILSFVIFFLYKCMFKKSALIALLAMSMFILFVPFLYNDSVSTYIAIVMQLGIGLFCASIIPLEKFKEKYINIIVLFAFISLFFYICSLIIPSIAQLFPVIHGGDGASVDYYNAYIYVFMKSKGYQDFVLSKRNSGICWEPGCYQAFLNIGLLFLLDKEKKVKQNNFYLKFIILIITIITTISTTGYILMFLILIVYLQVWTKKMKKIFVAFPLLILFLFIVFSFLPIGEMFKTKIENEFINGFGFLDRISINRIIYIFSDSGIPYFFGMSFSKWLTYDLSLWNSIIHSFLCLGIPFTIIQLIGYYKGGNVLLSKKYILFIVMLMCASTETLFWRVFFNTIAFYGWIYYDKYYKNYNKTKFYFD